MRAVANVFWISILAIVLLFAFFVALGAFSPTEVAWLSITVVALAALYVVHAIWVARHSAGRDPESIRARERRGF